MMKYRIALPQTGLSLRNGKELLFLKNPAGIGIIPGAGCCVIACIYPEQLHDSAASGFSRSLA